jgi:uncharacterized protein YeaO (DUF488 family)
LADRAHDAKSYAAALDHAARAAENAAMKRRRRALSRAAGELSSPACYLHELEADPPPAPPRDVAIKRIYERPEPADGFRALIDRLWPRGVSRRRAALDAWLVELAPSNALRAWFRHDPKRWAEFGRRYRAELRAQRAGVEALRQRAERMRVTLLTATREPRINHAVVLRALLLRRARPRRRAAPP